MPRYVLAAVLLLSSFGAQAQSSPNLSYGQVPTAGQWNSYFASKQDTLTFTPLNKSGGTMGGPLTTFPSTVSASGFSIAPGIAPLNPNSGDVWVSSNSIYVRIGTTTLDLTAQTSTLYLSSNPTIANIGLGQSRLVKNTATGTFARWANDGGVMVNLDMPKTY